MKSYEKYLGLPSFVGRGKKASFNYIKERVWRKLQGWEGKLLSQAEREVLIKSVIQAIPTYAMRCFKLPFGLCDDIEAIIKKFWWGQRGNSRKIHWIRWSELTKSKMVGGMGFMIWLTLMAPFWRNKHGGFCIIRKPSSIKSSRRSSSLISPS